ncbi:MAG TPA: hypothetical protein VE954_03710 [Oligoflexus sp.]|uniref:hypothetical protein n=1 Tax=Oligoflexus sp. TaxID=1971216 RepID=UPI002D5222E9|nr:hypothetical protein [Oligoflexus sp.]HYX32193.1 hypothetical protein [Oligoflexus sp.]
MSTSQLLEYIHRINNALVLDQLETIAAEIRRAGVFPGMHDEAPPDALTENMRNQRLLGQFLSIMDDKAHRMITPWLDQMIASFRGRWTEDENRCS